MDNNKFLDLAKQAVVHYYKETLGIEFDEVFVVWTCKTLQNNKAMLSTVARDNKYFEVTYNGDKNEMYFDAYIKEENIVIPVKD